MAGLWVWKVCSDFAFTHSPSMSSSHRRAVNSLTFGSTGRSAVAVMDPPYWRGVDRAIVVAMWLISWRKAQWRRRPETICPATLSQTRPQETAFSGNGKGRIGERLITIADNTRRIALSSAPP